MLLGNTAFSMYKIITIPDDDLVNPWRGLNLNLKSSDEMVLVQENCSYAVLWIKDNDGPQGYSANEKMIKQLRILFNPLDLEPTAWAKLADNHYSTTENGTFEVCVLACSLYGFTLKVCQPPCKKRFYLYAVVLQPAKS